MFFGRRELKRVWQLNLITASLPADKGRSYSHTLSRRGDSPGNLKFERETRRRRKS
jgi:hypothetical protein